MKNCHQMVCNSLKLEYFLTFIHSIFLLKSDFIATMIQEEQKIIFLKTVT